MAAGKRSAGTQPSLTLAAIGRATLARQMLLAREEVPALRAIERLVGLQAQWPRPPFVGLWSRVAGFESAELAKLLHARKAVRAPMMRGTIHVASAKDYLRFRASMQPMLTRGLYAVLRERAKGLDVSSVVTRARALLDEEPRTFEEVRDALAALHPEVDVRAMGFAVRMSMALVMVPTEAPAAFPTNADFAVAETWLGKPLKAAEPEGDARALFVRYLAAYGPATARDAQVWSGMTELRDVAARMQSDGDVITLKDERGKELLDLPDAPRPPGDTPAPARFLPEFDNVLLAHVDRGRIVAAEHRKQVFLPGLRVAPTVLVDGRVAATWKVARAKKAATLEITPFAPLGKAALREVEAEADALVRFAEPDAATFAVRFAKAR